MTHKYSKEGQAKRLKDFLGKEIDLKGKISKESYTKSKTPKKTVCIEKLSGVSEDINIDHTWVKKNDLHKGENIMFTATVVVYQKIENGKSVSDYGLSKLKNIVKFNDNCDDTALLAFTKRKKHESISNRNNSTSSTKTIESFKKEMGFIATVEMTESLVEEDEWICYLRRANSEEKSFKVCTGNTFGAAISKAWDIAKFFKGEL